MTAIEQAIKEAVENGMWKHGYQLFGLFGDGFFEVWNAAHTQDRITFEQAFLDPSFWQAFGKARGWINCEGRACGNCLQPLPDNHNIHYQWHRFIDHLAEGKDADSFFAAL
jgi:hypothetical protein